eukprot:6132239-Amphidinium_carterae.1
MSITLAELCSWAFASCLQGQVQRAMTNNSREWWERPAAEWGADEAAAPMDNQINQKERLSETHQQFCRAGWTSSKFLVFRKASTPLHYVVKRTRGIAGGWCSHCCSCSGQGLPASKRPALLPLSYRSLINLSCLSTSLGSVCDIGSIWLRAVESGVLRPNQQPRSTCALWKRDTQMVTLHLRNVWMASVGKLLRGEWSHPESTAVAACRMAAGYDDAAVEEPNLTEICL